MKDRTELNRAVICGYFLLAALTLLAYTPGCASPKGETSGEKRNYVDNMAAGSLAKLHVFKPETRDVIASAPGYAVFDAVQTMVLITSTGNGYGLVHNNRTGEDHYMSAFGLGAGLGVGIKAQRIIIVFEDEQMINKFITDGWVFGASGTATAAAVNVEQEAVGNTFFKDGMRTYTFTENGLMAGVSLRGGKVWPNKELN